jgi:recombination protein RecT
MAVNNSLVKKEKNGLVSLIEKSKKQFEIALPKHMNSERFVRIALTEIRKNPNLMKTDPKSLLGALMTSAQLGLEPGVLGQAYLIPYGKECQFQISYKGMIELLRRSGQLKDIYAYAVYENDEFEISYGLNRDLIHRPTSGDRGEVIGYYSVAKLTDGTISFEYMTKEEVEAHAKQFSVAYAKGYNSPWKSSFDSMAFKTVVKKMLKWLPVSVEMLNGLESDEQRFDYNPVTKKIEKVAETKIEELPEPTPESHDPETGEIQEEDFGGF